MIYITKALYRGHLDRIGLGETVSFYIFVEDVWKKLILVTSVCGKKFAKHKLTNGWGVTLEKKLIRPMLMADIS